MEELLFYTTFNKNGYLLYGKEWIQSFIHLVELNPSFKAKVFTEDFTPEEIHPSIEYIDYHTTIPQYFEWKEKYLEFTPHSDKLKKMIPRFAYKSFVTQYILKGETSKYVIWLDGDCIFKPIRYKDFLPSILEGTFIACQVEFNPRLNHIESGILIFNNHHKDKNKFLEYFTHNYKIEKVISPMLPVPPSDGHLLYKTLLDSKINFINLNKGIGGIKMTDSPSETFLNPKISDKFIHNIGRNGKVNYKEWKNILNQDEVFQIVEKDFQTNYGFS